MTTGTTGGTARPRQDRGAGPQPLPTQAQAVTEAVATARPDAEYRLQDS